MESAGLEIDEVRMLYQGEGLASPRAELITRRAFEILQEMVETDMPRVNRDYTIEHLMVPPIEISLDQLPDEAIAQATAATLFRALLNEI
jgi:hypothetical protein